MPAPTTAGEPSRIRGSEGWNSKRNMAPEGESRPARVFLVDDHLLVRQHLAALVQAEPDLQMCGEAGDAPTALALIRQLEPDLVILDISLRQSQGLDLLTSLKASLPNLAVLVWSMHDEGLYAERAFAAGAMGYLTKEEATVAILPAIRCVLAGQVYLSEGMARRMSTRSASQQPSVELQV